MTVTVADSFSILTGGYFNSSQATIITGQLPSTSPSGNFLNLLNQICSITTETQDGTFNDYGEPVVTEATITDIRCRLDEEINTYIQDGKVLNVKEFILFLLPETDINLRDTIAINSRNYTVTDVDSLYDKGFLHHKEVTVQRMASTV